MERVARPHLERRGDRPAGHGDQTRAHQRSAGTAARVVARPPYETLGDRRFQPRGRPRSGRHAQPCRHTRPGNGRERTAGRRSRVSIRSEMSMELTLRGPGPRPLARRGAAISPALPGGRPGCMRRPAHVSGTPRAGGGRASSSSEKWEASPADGFSPALAPRHWNAASRDAARRDAFAAALLAREGRSEPTDSLKSVRGALHWIA
jgi:hypothetical protein